VWALPPPYQDVELSVSSMSTDAVMAKTMGMPVTSRFVKDGWEWERTTRPDGITRERRLGRAVVHEPQQLELHTEEESIYHGGWGSILGGRDED
jgi:hypothetical protein